MKRFIIIAALTVLSSTGSTSAQAQSSDFYVRINGTAGFPLSPEQFRDRYESGLGGGVTLGYLLLTGVELTADLSIQRYLVQDDTLTAAMMDRAFAASDPFYSGDALFVTGMLGSRFHLTSDSPVSGHILLEGGFQRTSTITNTVDSSGGETRIPGEVETAPVVAAGLGTTIGLTRSVGVYAQISYNIVFAEQHVHYAPLKAGIIFRLGSTNW